MYSMSEYAGPNPEELIDVYGRDAPVMAGEFPDPIPLGTALALEQRFCRPANLDEARKPENRVAQMVKMLAAAGTLRPEHYGLLKDTDRHLVNGLTND
jgi:hypothetical protein